MRLKSPTCAHQLHPQESTDKSNLRLRRWIVGRPRLSCFPMLLSFFAGLLLPLPIAFLVIASYCVLILSLHRRQIKSWARDQHLPSGEWLVEYNIFTSHGTKRFGPHKFTSFEGAVSVLGVRTRSEVERIRQMTLDSQEGGIEWVTIYNPPRLQDLDILPYSNQVDAQLLWPEPHSTFTVRFRAPKPAGDSVKHDPVV